MPLYGVFLSALGTFFGELASSFGKRKVKEKDLSPYSMAFVQTVGALVLFGLWILVKQDSFVFQTASLKTFLPRLVLEILQLQAMVFGLINADRSTFTFLRVGTVPLLLTVDVILGYALSWFQIIGIAIIASTFLVVFVAPQVKKVGTRWVVFGMFNAVATISLYKYDITHFNSVAAEQIFIIIPTLIYLFFMARIMAQENPFTFFRRASYIGQALFEGGGSVSINFAYVFAPASVITAAKRSTEVLWGVLAGWLYFREKSPFFKFSLFILLSGGLILLVL
ncbi:MAG: hypothetical protein HY396_00590 [Candidatus Doudnabacteria bacterium]|nr:hypothetical protein [Candidatus Doudnabacteria bacterium]